MLELAVHSEGRSIVTHMKEAVICGALGVEFSTNPEDSLPFPTTFDFIRAEFNPAGASNITRRPARHVSEALDDDLTWLRANRCSVLEK